MFKIYLFNTCSVGFSPFEILWNIESSVAKVYESAFEEKFQKVKSLF